MVVTLGIRWPFLEPIWSIGPKFFEFLTPAALWQVGGGGRWWSPLGPDGLSLSPSGQLGQSSLNFLHLPPCGRWEVGVDGSHTWDQVAFP